jgi:hypothetical protein
VSSMDSTVSRRSHTSEDDDDGDGDADRVIYVAHDGTDDRTSAERRISGLS